MSRTELVPCPTCGITPSFYWKNYTFGKCSGALKCSLEHHRVSVGYWAGGQEKARRELKILWQALVAGIEQDKRNG